MQRPFVDALLHADGIVFERLPAKSKNLSGTKSSKIASREIGFSLRSNAAMLLIFLFDQHFFDPGINLRAILPAEFDSSLAFKNSLICESVRLSAFRILMCAFPSGLSIPILPVQDHLVFDNSKSGAKRKFGVQSLHA